MLAVLSPKLKKRGLFAEVRCADVCRLRLRASFTLAILPFQSFMEIVGEERQRQALRAVLGCLAPGGRFICTLHNPAVRRASVDGRLRIVGKYPTPDGALAVSGIEEGGQPVVRRQQFFEFFASDGRLREKKVLSIRRSTSSLANGDSEDGCPWVLDFTPSGCWSALLHRRS